jgi:hypothetical protein
MPVVAKLKTITDPFIGSEEYLREFELMIPTGIQKFQSFFDTKFAPKFGWLKINGILPIMKAGGGYSVSLAKLLELPAALRSANLWDPLCHFVALSNNELLLRQIAQVDDLATRAKAIWGDAASSTHLGRLSFKEEAAGKLRVFAMVDCLTQSALYGLHEWLFKLLERIPNDGTFNQEAAFSRAQVKAKKYGVSFGYDLSSATDRLPRSIQVKILESWFGIEKAQLWCKLLVERDYIVLEGKRTSKFGITPGPYRYSVGQPMGAYSSWAMLAITHHYIVQWAHFQAYPYMSRMWFEGYELLGDDIVIFDELVAKKYLEIMQGLGVEINLSKSVVSNPGSVVEFAKRTSIKGIDVSAISLKMLQAASDVKSKAQVALYLSLKTARQIGNYFKALYSLGPSQLYKMDAMPSSVRKAEASMIMQLLKPDWSNFPTIFKASIPVTDGYMDSWEDIITSGKPMGINPHTAHMLVSKLIRGEDVKLRSTTTQQSCYYDLERTLKPLMVEKVLGLLKKVYPRFFYDSEYAAELLLSPYLEEASTESTEFTSTKSKSYWIEVNGKRIDRYSDEMMDFNRKLYNFLWDAWFEAPLEKTYVTILSTIGQSNLYLEREPHDLRNLIQRFDGSVAYKDYYEDLPLEKLFFLCGELESLLSVPARFKYGWDKIRGVERPLPKSDPLDFANAIVTDISVLLRKAHKSGRIGYLDTWGNRF